MSPTAEILTELEEAIRSAPVEDLPRLAGVLAEAQARLALRLAAPPTSSGNGQAGGEDRLLTLPEVAEILGIPEEHAREMGRRGELVVIRVGRYVRVRRAALSRWIELREKKALDTGHTGRIVKLHERSGAAKDPPAAEAQAGRPRREHRRRGEHRRAVGTVGDAHHGADEPAHPAGHRATAEGS